VLGNQSLRLCANCNDLHKKCLSKSDKTDLTRNCEAIRKKKEQAKGKRMNEKAAIKAKGKEEAAKRKLKKGVSCECPHCSKYGKLIALPKFTYQRGPFFFWKLFEFFLLRHKSFLKLMKIIFGRTFRKNLKRLRPRLFYTRSFPSVYAPCAIF